MTDDEILQSYTTILPFLSQVLGPGCELVVHDARDLEHSLIAIENPLSGRKVGDRITDLAASFLEEFDSTDKTCVLNYTGYANHIEFLDSTFFIRGNSGRIIGFFCINKDLRYIKKIGDSLNELISAFNLGAPKESSYSESLNTVVAQMVTEKIENVIQSTGVPLDRMTRDEKMLIIRKLKENGVLDMKGAVAETASIMKVSVPTVYRYMKEV